MSFVQCRSFKCSLHVANAVFIAQRIAYLERLDYCRCLRGGNGKRMPTLMYGAEDCSLNKSDIDELIVFVFVVNRFFSEIV